MVQLFTGTRQSHLTNTAGMADPVWLELDEVERDAVVQHIWALWKLSGKVRRPSRRDLDSALSTEDWETWRVRADTAASYLRAWERAEMPTARSRAWADFTIVAIRRILDRAEKRIQTNAPLCS